MASTAYTARICCWCSVSFLVHTREWRDPLPAGNTLIPTIYLFWICTLNYLSILYLDAFKKQFPLQQLEPASTGEYLRRDSGLNCNGQHR